MYHIDLGKSTLDMWGEEQDARRARQRKLAEVATLLQVLLDKRSRQERDVQNDKGEYDD